MKTQPQSGIEQLKQFIRQPYAWPGGYPKMAIMGDGEALCKSCAKTEYRRIVRNTVQGYGRSFQVIDVGINWEDNDCYCAHCNGKIESAYSE